jgi:membrane protease YdiL (CAAX protease family)
VLVPYAAALGLMHLASTLLVLGVALERASGDRAQLMAQAVSFSVSASGLMSVALVNAGVLASVSLVAARSPRADLATHLRLGPTRASPSGAAAAIVGMVGLNFAFGAATDLLGIRGGGVMDRVARALAGPTPAEFALAVVTIALAPGFAEETFFRGLLQPRLTSRLGLWPAIVATSVGFGVMHQDPIQGSLAVLAGLFLGWTADRLGGVRPTIAAHAVNNAMAVLLASIGQAGPTSRSAQIVVLVLSSTFFVTSVMVLRGESATLATSDLTASRRAS